MTETEKMENTQVQPVKTVGKTLASLQRAWEILKTAITYTMMTAAMGMLLFTALSLSAFDRDDRDLLGYKAFIVRSDSMKATDFAAGDLVVIREVDPGILQVGDIIAFRTRDPEFPGETVTHKIRSITTDEFGQRTFITYGTTTGVEDAAPVPQGSILGRYQFRIPNLGKFFAFLKTAPGYLCCIALPFLILLFIQGSNSVKYAKEIYREKQREHQSQLDAITAQIRKLEQQNQQLQEAVQNLCGSLQNQQ